MNPKELERLSEMVRAYETANGPVATKVGPATNCTGCSGGCSGGCNNFCTSSCRNYCDGSGRGCWKSHIYG